MQTKVPGIETDESDEIGGWLVGEVRASYARLEELFGPPNSEGDGYKVSTEWRLKYGEHRFRLYDYKETSLYGGSSAPSVEEFRALPSYEWHIGGTNDLPVDRLKSLLREHLR